MTNKMRYLLVALMLFSFSSCATQPMPKAERVELEKEIPEAIIKSYEVSDAPKDSSAKKVAPTVIHDEPATTATVVETKKKIKESKKEKQTATSSIPFRRPKVDPFRQGEKVTFDVTWLKTTAGELSLEILPLKYIEGRQVYHFKGTARTTSFIASFYRAEDFVESFVDYEGLFPYKFILFGDESKHRRDGLEMYDHVKGKQYVYIKDDRLNGDVSEDKGIKDLVPYAQDALSVLYYLRTLKLEKDKSEDVSVATFGKMSLLTVTNVGPEDLKTKTGRFNALKLKVIMLYKGEKKYEENTFWVTNDDRRIPLKFEMKVKIGWVSGILKHVNYGEPFPNVGK